MDFRSVFVFPILLNKNGLRVFCQTLLILNKGITIFQLMAP